MTDLSHLTLENRALAQKARIASACNEGARKARKNLIQAVANQLRNEYESGLIRKPYIQGVSDG
jgi:hypothetical protein